MKASNKLTETDQIILAEGDTPLDPFAVDIFGVHPPSTEIALADEIRAIKPKIKRAKKSDWAKHLPRLTNQEVEFSYALQEIPAGLSEKAIQIITESIARYTFRQPENIDLSIISVAETNLNEAVGKINNSPKVFFNLISQPTNATAVIAVNTEFAASIIDLILGGKGAETFHLRGLSPIEKAILQFLTLNILQEINDFLGAPTLFLQNITHKLQDNFSPNERGAEIVANLELNQLSGIFSLIIAQKFLQSLEKSQNPLLKKTDWKKLKFFEKFTPSLDLQLQIGTTTLDGESLLFLEPDDIVLLEKPGISWQEGGFSDKLQVFIGRGKNFRLSGIIENTDDEINFKIEEILSEETRRKLTAAKFKMDEKENQLTEEMEAEINRDEANDAEISVALENIQVALRVEIAGNKLSLRELQNLRAGQVIALGCRPTDPVRLVTDNNDEPVANGELIEIEGQLGVRLTKVFI